MSPTILSFTDADVFLSTPDSLNVIVLVSLGGAVFFVASDPLSYNFFSFFPPSQLAFFWPRLPDAQTDFSARLYLLAHVGLTTIFFLSVVKEFFRVFLTKTVTAVWRKQAWSHDLSQLKSEVGVGLTSVLGKHFGGIPFPLGLKNNEKVGGVFSGLYCYYYFLIESICHKWQVHNSIIILIC